MSALGFKALIILVTSALLAVAAGVETTQRTRDLERGQGSVVTIGIDVAYAQRRVLGRKTVELDCLCRELRITIEADPSLGLINQTVTMSFPPANDALESIMCMLGPGREQLNWRVRVSYFSPQLTQIAATQQRIQVRDACGTCDLSVVATACGNYDRDGDYDVDLRDFAAIQRDGK